MASWAGGPRQDAGQGQGGQPASWWEPPPRVSLPRRPIGNLIRTAFEAYGRSFVPFLCLSGLVYAIAGLVLVPVDLRLADIVGQILVATPVSPGADYTAYQALMTRVGPQEAALSVLAAIVTAVMQPLALGAVMAGTPEAAQGLPVGFRTSLSRLMARLPPLLGLALIFVLVQGGLAMAAAGIQLEEPAMVAYDSAGLPQFGTSLGVFFLLGLVAICLAVVGLYLYLRWSVAIPAIVIDGLGLRAAIARSARLTEGSRWYILGALILILLLQLLFSLLIEVIAAIIGAAVGAASLAGGTLATGSGGSLSFSAGFGALAGRATAFSSLVSLFLGAIYYPVIGIAMAILRSDFMWRADTIAQLQAPPPGP
ncbi:MAG TPA: glycerophosphoryl diester phosphodiesterase membrane domain-containing protein [Candidatus Sulfotelmatobacter sp.]|nr:glycerophosphoryl diester phosphodiesterase membrane domain-containing protein [Candidatus Sulfotelmatobacter sp.]